MDMFEKLIAYFMVFGAAIVAPLHYDLLAIMALCTVDMAFGIMAAMKNGEPFESRKLKSSVVKILVYQVTILTASLCQTYIFENAFPLINITMGVIGLVELTSLLENLSVITGNQVGTLIRDKITNLLNSSKPKENKEKEKKEKDGEE